jgi:protein-S-isoprenylcysteine O-methyltransferase Ste14
MTTWRGGVALVKEVRRCLAAGRPSEAALILLGVSANLLNICYEMGRRLWNLPNYQLRFPTPLRIAGCALFIAGFAYVVRARQALGRSWAVVPQAPPTGLHITGPYRLVRHPIYMGAVALYLGLLLMQNNVTGAIVFGAQVSGFILKAAREDRFLSTSMPEEYDAYKRRVKWHMFPGIW